MGRMWKVILCIAFLLIILGLPMRAYAHGVTIDVTIQYTTNIEIVAKYDTGEPMSGAQVVVYAPDDPSTPWLTGVCDDEGRFTFTPDSSKPGRWYVRVRQAGHGDIRYFSVGEDTVVSGGSGGYSGLQIGLMAVCVIWGGVGTALYFSRRRA